MIVLNHCNCSLYNMLCFLTSKCLFPILVVLYSET
uniref:Uncharacterized protein n=1 Tax=Arundo donax TaxID=35708 RepID=A0A0A9F7V2_ARUDO